jgi:hypothetical protein
MHETLEEQRGPSAINSFGRVGLDREPIVEAPCIHFFSRFKNINTDCASSGLVANSVGRLPPSFRQQELQDVAVPLVDSMGRFFRLTRRLEIDRLETLGRIELERLEKSR